jgi:biotin carboxyl carrier protein
LADRPGRRGLAAAAPTESDAATMERLAAELLPALVARLESSSLGELEIRRGGWHIRLRRGAQAAPEASAAVHPKVVTARSRPVTLAAVGPGLPAPAIDPRVIAVSPAVGYFAPLSTVTTGGPVRTGDVLGHVDVLGVRQAVVAPADGVLGRYLAEPGEAVEYGQELVRLEAAPALDGHGPAIATDGP